MVVIDANVINSALLKKAETRRLLLSEEMPTLITPDYVHKEIQKYAGEFAKRLHVEEKEVHDTIEALFSAANIQTIPRVEYEAQIEKARQISPDPDDVHYFALALHFDCPIWTNDKALKKQNKVTIIGTTEMIHQNR